MSTSEAELAEPGYVHQQIDLGWGSSLVIPGELVTALMALVLLTVIFLCLFRGPLSKRLEDRGSVLRLRIPLVKVDVAPRTGLAGELENSRQCAPKRREPCRSSRSVGLERFLERAESHTRNAGQSVTRQQSPAELGWDGSSDPRHGLRGLIVTVLLAIINRLGH